MDRCNDYQQDDPNRDNDTQQRVNDFYENLMDKLKNTNELDDEFFKFAVSQANLNVDSMLNSNEFKRERGNVDMASINSILYKNRQFGQENGFQSKITNSNEATISEETIAKEYPNRGQNNALIYRNYDQERCFNIDMHPNVPNCKVPMNMRQHVLRSDSFNSISSEHNEQKRYRCEVCNKAFWTNYNLVAHFRTHTGENPFFCEICQKAFKQQAHLKTHMVMRRSRKLFKCLDCGKAFKHQWNLNTHMVTHTSEKRFKCLDCGKAFTLKRTLKEHAVVHTGAKPFKCKHCDAFFSYRSGLSYHQKKHIK